MEETFMVKEIEVGGDTNVGDVAFERNTVRAKGFVAGASIVAGAWLATVLYKKFKNRKVEEVTKKSEGEKE